MTTKKRARDACHIRVQFAKLYLENGFLIFFFFPTYAVKKKQISVLILNPYKVD